MLLASIVTITVTSNFSYGQFTVQRAKLKHHFKAKHIRVFYDTEGEHAVEAEDNNGNKVPDRVEDIAKQIWAAHEVFVKAFDFPEPLESDRYKAATFIDANLLSRETIGMNGIAYDGLQNFKRSIDPPNTKTICLDIATDVDAKSNITPAHEYFHLIQYGATYFKTRWYLEGMARWSEHGLQRDGIGRIKYKGDWPQSKRDREVLFKLAYDAEFTFWNPLAKLDDRSGKIDPDSVSRVVHQLKYSNGKSVLKDFKLNGVEFMRDVLSKLGEADDLAYEKLNLKKWSEANQKSQKNSPFIYQAVMDVARKRGLKVGPFLAEP